MSEGAPVVLQGVAQPKEGTCTIPLGGARTVPEKCGAGYLGVSCARCLLEGACTVTSRGRVRGTYRGGVHGTSGARMHGTSGASVHGTFGSDVHRTARRWGARYHPGIVRTAPSEGGVHSFWPIRTRLDPTNGPTDVRRPPRYQGMAPRGARRLVGAACRASAAASRVALRSTPRWIGPHGAP